MKNAQYRLRTKGLKGKSGFGMGVALALVTGLGMPFAIAASPPIAEQNYQNSDVLAEVGDNIAPVPSLAQRRPLPRLVKRSVRLDAARRSGQNLEAQQVTDYKAEVWPNGCLGLGDIEEVCSQSLVSGWRVTVTNDAQTWVYRSNASGRIVRLESVDGSALSDGNGLAESRENRGFIGDSSTSTAPLPEERQPISAQLSPLDGQVRITLDNRTNANITYQVIGDTTQRTLLGKTVVVLRLLETPTTVTFRRDDGGLLDVVTQVQDEAYGLEVILDTTVDLGRDRTTLTVEREGDVFLN